MTKLSDKEASKLAKRISKEKTPHSVDGITVQTGDVPSRKTTVLSTILGTVAGARRRRN